MPRAFLLPQPISGNLGNGPVAMETGWGGLQVNSLVAMALINKRGSGANDLLRVMGYPAIFLKIGRTAKYNITDIKMSILFNFNDNSFKVSKCESLT